MKKLFLILVIIAALVYLFFYKPSSTKVTQIPTNTTTGENPDPSSATFIFDDEKITLSKGISSAAGDTGLEMETKVLEEKAYGDLNKDDKNDTALLLSQTGGGTGVFIYTAAYISGPISYKGTNAIFLGDRVSPQSISIKNGVITVNYLDRKPSESFAEEPTVPTFKQFVFLSGELVEK